MTAVFSSLALNMRSTANSRPMSNHSLTDKCIGDDTKAAARQNLNYIKNKKIKYGKKRFSIWRLEFLHPAMWHDHDIDFAR